jgi:hypothetical protein
MSVCQIASNNLSLAGFEALHVSSHLDLCQTFTARVRGADNSLATLKKHGIRNRSTIADFPISSLADGFNRVPKVGTRIFASL